MHPSNRCVPLHAIRPPVHVGLPSPSHEVHPISWVAATPGLADYHGTTDAVRSCMAREACTVERVWAGSMMRMGTCQLLAVVVLACEFVCGSGLRGRRVPGVTPVSVSLVLSVSARRDRPRRRAGRDGAAASGEGGRGGRGCMDGGVSRIVHRHEHRHGDH